MDKKTRKRLKKILSEGYFGYSSETPAEHHEFDSPYTDDELRQERVRLQALMACRAEVIKKKGKDGPSRFSATQAEERNEDARRRIAWIDSVLAYREELKRQEKAGSKNPPVRTKDSSTRRKTG